MYTTWSTWRLLDDPLRDAPTDPQDLPRLDRADSRGVRAARSGIRGGARPSPGHLGSHQERRAPPSRPGGRRPAVSPPDRPAVDGAGLAADLSHLRGPRLA